MFVRRGNGTRVLCIAIERAGNPPCMTSPVEYRRFAKECLEMARSTNDEQTRAIFSQMAHVWFRLAEEKAHSGANEEKV